MAINNINREIEAHDKHGGVNKLERRATSCHANQVFIGTAANKSSDAKVAKSKSISKLIKARGYRPEIKFEALILSQAHESYGS